MSYGQPIQFELTRRHSGKVEFTLLTISLILLCVAASYKSTHNVGGGPRCAFSDPEFTTSLGICNIAAEYYVANHEWPLAKVQLEEQWKKMIESMKQDLPQDEAKELSNFLNRFMLLDFRRDGDRLVFHYRFEDSAPSKTVDQTVTFMPGATTDEILTSLRSKSS
jgi:hypothetical protein